MNQVYLFLISLLFMSSAGAADKVKLYLKWKHQFQFAGYYAALEQGFYEEEGLDVEIIARDIAWKPYEKILEEPGSYAITDSSIVFEYLQGQPFIIVNSIFQHSPLVIVTRAEDRLLGPLELKGKRLMYQRGVDDAAIKIMFQNSGLKESDIHAVAHSMKIEDLIDKKIDAMSVYSTNQPYEFQELGKKIHIIRPENYGVDLYGDTLVTTRSEADENPERVEAMRRASIRGWYYALSNSEEVIQLIHSKYNPEMGIDKLRFEAQATKDIIRPDLIPIGETRLGRLQRMINYYKQGEDINLSEFDDLLFDRYMETKDRISPKTFYRLALLFCVILIAVAMVLVFNRRLKVKIAERTKDLEKIQEQRDLFFSSMTHELRTPLNGILGSVHFLKEAKSQSQQEEYIKAIEQSGEILLKIVDDILDLTRLEKKKLELSEETVRLDDLIRNLLLVFEKRASAKGLAFQFQSESDCKIWVKVDPTKLSQIVNNLLANALKFTEKGEITFKMEVERADASQELKLHFSVLDTGPGVPEEAMDQLFKPFSQATKEVSSKLGGTGLGLSISRELARLMGGEIDAKRRSPRGMDFSFFIQCLEVEAPIATPRPEIQPIDLSHLRVLVADDNPVNLMLLERYLQKFKIKPVAVANGKEALQAIEQSEFDLVFMDRQMPEMNGLEAVEIIRSHQDQRIRTSYIIGQSADWRNIQEAEYKKWGLNSTLAKPTKFKDVRASLEKYLKDSAS